MQPLVYHWDLNDLHIKPKSKGRGFEYPGGKAQTTWKKTKYYLVVEARPRRWSSSQSVRFLLQ